MGDVYPPPILFFGTFFSSLNGYKERKESLKNLCAFVTLRQTAKILIEIAMNPILTQLGHLGVIPVVVLDDAAHAHPLGQALLDGGLPCAEITFRTAAAESSIRTMSAAFPDMLIGAGTVLTVAQAETAVAAGAKFIATPGFDAAVVDWCLAHDIPITPGVMTPTEINMALNKGLNILKFFPTEAAGRIRTIKGIAAPYGG